jgi:hypothetical protein
MKEQPEGLLLPGYFGSLCIIFFYRTSAADFFKFDPS